MIFDNLNESYVGGDVAPSPYTLGLEGALMHVYENERNYCEMMKAVGISEARYYAETGQDLFLNESGAFSSFLENAKKFFKKVWEKIKSIFKALYAKIYSFVGDDKKFVKKYEKQLLRVNMQDFEFEGYEFTGLNSNITLKLDKAQEVEAYIDKLGKQYIQYKIGAANIDLTYKNIKDKKDLTNYTPFGQYAKKIYSDEDAKTKEKERIRGNLIGSSSPMDEQEFRDEVKNKFYGNDGEKTTLENISIRTQLQIITNAEANIKVAKKMEKDATKWLEDLIKKLDNFIKETNKSDKPVTDNGNTVIANANDVIDILRSTSNDVTVYCGLFVQAIKDANRQAKAICVKALTYKVKESANYGYSESYFNGDDLLGNVELL